MTWSCEACTFDNGSDDSVKCAICGTSRRGNGSVIDLTTRIPPHKRPPSKDPQQRTLFGAVATTIPRNSKKKQRVDTAPSEPTKKPAAVSSKQSRMFQHKSRIVSTSAYPALKVKAEHNLKTIFGMDELRKLQPLAVEGALRRKSQIIVMATGGGKSLCYQLPATVLGGVTLVISPLIALMVDQVQALLERGISAALVSSANGQKNNTIVMERLLGRRFGNNPKDNSPLQPISLLYCTPELIQTDRFRGTLRELHQKQGLAMFAIDEAHCVSTWGHDFRAAYRKLSWLRDEFPTVPIMACTATATKKVLNDIRETLQLDEDEVPCHISTFNRPNIEYQVRFKDSLDALRPGGALGDLLDFVTKQHSAGGKNVPCSGIVYVHKREDTTFLAKQLSTKVPAAPYHAGLKDAERAEMQQNWTCGKIKIAVATVAFGMGIDLAHVRYVIHWNIAKTVEGFYQESGRGGRDGLPAISILYYSKDDVNKFAYIIKKSAAASKKKEDGAAGGGCNTKLQALEQMSNYCREPCCRRQYLLNHFGEQSDPKVLCKKTCDYCQNPSKVSKASAACDVMKEAMQSAANVRRHAAKKSEWNGQWNKPHDDEDEEEEGFGGNRSWTAGDLRITKGDEEFFPAIKKRGFTATSAVLSKYAKMESNQEGDTLLPAGGGFVTFKPVVIPEHLREGLPDPLGHLAGRKEVDSSSLALGDRAAQLKVSLAKLKADGEARLKALQAKYSSAASSGKSGLAPPPPPPPFLAMANKKQRRQRKP